LSIHLVVNHCQERLPGIVSIDLQAYLSKETRHDREVTYVVENVDKNQDTHSKVNLPEELPLQLAPTFSPAISCIGIALGGYGGRLNLGFV
jgi:hypothetical protein